MARTIGNEYAQFPQVDAVIVGGSTARGHADKFSDIEIGVFWNVSPTDAQRQQVAEKYSTDYMRLYPYDINEAVWADDFVVGRNANGEHQSGVMVEIVHHTSDFIDYTLDHILRKHNVDLLGQNLIAGIMDGQIIYGESHIKKWHELAHDYPDELASKMVRQYAIIDHFWRWEMFLERGDNLMLLNQSFAKVQHRLLYMLLGLNRIYYFGFKWLDVVVGRMTITPDNFLERMRNVYRVSPEQGARELVALVDETYDLLEQHMPDLPMERLREIFHYKRAECLIRPQNIANDKS